MKIYFDGTLIDEENYVEIIKSAKVYDNKFRLGTTICETYTFTINKDGFSSIPSVITVYENNVLVKTLNVIKCEDKDNFTAILTTEDSMTKFNFYYDASPIMTRTKIVSGKTVYYAYLYEIINDICTKAGVSLDSSIVNFRGYNLEVSWYDNTLLARDYLSFIAELNVKNFIISADNKLIFKDIVENSHKTITDDEISSYKIGDRHQITKVVFGDWVYGNDTGETYYINENNVYITSTNDVQYIYNQLNGFEYYDIEAENCNINGLEAGDKFRFTIDGVDYRTFNQYENATYYGVDWYCNIRNKFDNEIQQETEIIGTEDKFRRIKRTIDYEAGRIDQVVEEQTEQGTQISTISQEVDAVEISVGQKLNSSDFTNATITAKINDGTSTVKLSANKLDLSGYATFTNLSTAGQTTINGENITTGIIKSNNYVANTSGTSINLTNGVIDTKNFKVDSTGNITANNVILNSGTFKGDINTSQNCTVGNNLYVGQNQDPSQLSSKEIYFTNKTYIQRLSSYGYDRLIINNDAGEVVVRQDLIVEREVGGGVYEQLMWASSVNNKVEMVNMDCGSGYCNSNGETHINFNKTFASIPKIIATPTTRTNGVIALKITGKSTTGFDITIGGQGFSNNEPFDWIAMY